MIEKITLPGQKIEEPKAEALVQETTEVAADKSLRTKESEEAAELMGRITNAKRLAERYLTIMKTRLIKPIHENEHPEEEEQAEAVAIETVESLRKAFLGNETAEEAFQKIQNSLHAIRTFETRSGIRAGGNRVVHRRAEGGISYFKEKEKMIEGLFEIIKNSLT